MGGFDTTRQAYPLLTKEAPDMGLGNIRNDTYGRVYTRRDRSILVKDYTQTGNVANGDIEVVSITVPTGKIWRIHNLRMFVKADADATSGTHRLHVYFDTYWDVWLYGKSNYNTNLDFSGNVWAIADVEQRPSTEVAQVEVVKGIVIDEDTPLKIRYINDTDAPQENDREYKLVVEEVWS